MAEGHLQPVNGCPATQNPEKASRSQQTQNPFIM